MVGLLLIVLICDLMVRKVYEKYHSPEIPDTSTMRVFTPAPERTRG